MAKGYIRMKIMVVAQVEDRAHLDKEIAKQTMVPDLIYMYIDTEPAQGINDRRKRIASNHEYLRQAVINNKPDLVWQLEGDCILDKDTLKILYSNYLELSELIGPKFGYISGIQVGRHGLYCLGAWRNITSYSFESIDHRLSGLQQVDATGFYCLLMDADKWLEGQVSRVS